MSNSKYTIMGIIDGIVIVLLFNGFYYLTFWLTGHSGYSCFISILATLIILTCMIIDFFRKSMRDDDEASVTQIYKEVTFNKIKTQSTEVPPERKVQNTEQRVEKLRQINTLK